MAHHSAHASRGIQPGQGFALVGTGVQSCQAPALTCARAQTRTLALTWWGRGVQLQLQLQLRPAPALTHTGAGRTARTKRCAARSMAKVNTTGRCPGMPVPGSAATSVTMAATRGSARTPSMRVPGCTPCLWKEHCGRRPAPAAKAASTSMSRCVSKCPRTTGGTAPSSPRGKLKSPPTTNGAFPSRAAYWSTESHPTAPH